MHLGNGIICPVTGVPMLLAAGAMAIYSFKSLKETKKVFLKENLRLF